jgi:nucleoside-diphosphate-sugar epimerase
MVTIEQENNRLSGSEKENAMSAQRTALVLGANGGIGSELTRALLKNGYRVRALARTLPKNPVDLQHPHLEWQIGDAMLRSDVMNAASDASLIVHAVNPANYHNWRGLALPMLDNTIAAAEVYGARILFPGTVYNYGRDAFPLLDEQSEQTPHTKKGAVRVEMEERLRDASWNGRVRVLIVRTGDFFGAAAGSSWFSQGVLPPGRSVSVVLNPGPKHQLHSWSYLPDVAEVSMRLLAKESSLAKYDTFHVKGYWLSNDDMMRSICRVAGIGTQCILPFPWGAVRMSAPLIEASREMLEMRYLWDEAVELDNTKLRNFIGEEPQTPLDEAIRATLVGIGRLREHSTCSGVTQLFKF